MGFPGGSCGKESACNAGDGGLIPGLGSRSPGEGNGNPLHCSCLGNLMDRGAWQAAAHGVARVRHKIATKSSPAYCFTNASLLYKFQLCSKEKIGECRS